MPWSSTGRTCSPTAPEWVLVANLPYNVATPLVLDLLDAVPAIRRMLVMVQREVGERLAAAPGDKAYGIPSVKVAYWATARVVGKVGPDVFVPRPRWSRHWSRSSGGRPARPWMPTRISCSPWSGPGSASAARCCAGARAGSSTPGRSTAAGVDPTARAEELDLEAWGRLTRATAPA